MCTDRMIVTREEYRDRMQSPLSSDRSFTFVEGFEVDTNTDGAIIISITLEDVEAIEADVNCIPSAYVEGYWPLLAPVDERNAGIVELNQSLLLEELQAEQWQRCR